MCTMFRWELRRQLAMERFEKERMEEEAAETRLYEEDRKKRKRQEDVERDLTRRLRELDADRGGLLTMMQAPWWRLP